jgi:delta-aminolevulinic acid dehydratase/porphobilinogen synthase
MGGAAYPFLSALGIVEALQGYKVVTKRQLLIPTFVKIDPCTRETIDSFPGATKADTLDISGDPEKDH